MRLFSGLTLLVVLLLTVPPTGNVGGIQLTRQASAQEVTDLSTNASGAFVNAPQNAATEVVRNERFPSAYIKAVSQLVSTAKITSAEGMKLRIAVYTPAGRFLFEEYAITQMALSVDADVLPFSDDGKIERDKINWHEFEEFLLKIAPYHLKLLESFGL